MIRKQILDNFCNGLVQQFKQYSEGFKEEINVDNFATYLIDRQLISESIIKRFVIQQEFELLSKNKEKSKTQHVRFLAGKYNLSERSIWGMIKKNKIAIST